MRKQSRGKTLAAASVLAAAALAPLVPWTFRNWHDFHRFQPLAPRYANAPGEFVPSGLQRWVRTWIADYTSVPEFYWAYGEGSFDTTKLPSRAFDSAEERQRVEEIFAEYNDHGLNWTPALDFELGKVADARIGRAPLRYYVSLPAVRIADMWLRPRTDTLGIDDHWWDLAGNPEDSAKSITLAALNLFYVAVALYALVARPWGDYWGLAVAFVIARSLFLGTLENPEPRYTLECYPVVILVAAAAFVVRTRARVSPAGAQSEQDACESVEIRG